MKDERHEHATIDDLLTHKQQILIGWSVSLGFCVVFWAAVIGVVVWIVSKFA